MRGDDQVWKKVWYILNSILIRTGGKGCAPKGSSAVSLNTKTYPDLVSMCAVVDNVATRAVQDDAASRLGKPKRKRRKSQVKGAKQLEQKKLTLEFLKRNS